MPKLNLIYAPDRLLKSKTVAVEVVDARVRALMDNLLATMYEAPGIGLAAPQVGALRRVLVVDVAGTDEPRQPICMANPRIIWQSKETGVFEEGCLSFPDLYADVERPCACGVKFLNRDGKPQTLEAEDLLARCIQHEVDHLDGILFVDYLSPLKRNMILRKMTKWKKANLA